jgi:hypothetical protein
MGEQSSATHLIGFQETVSEMKLFHVLEGR